MAAAAAMMAAAAAAAAQQQRQPGDPHATPANTFFSLGFVAVCVSGDDGERAAECCGRCYLRPSASGAAVLGRLH